MARFCLGVLLGFVAVFAASTYQAPTAHAEDTCPSGVICHPKSGKPFCCAEFEKCSDDKETCVEDPSKKKK